MAKGDDMRKNGVSEEELEIAEPEDSISGRSAELYFARDESLASLPLQHGIKVREFILLSFLSDQGPMTIDQLSRIVSIKPKDLMESVKLLSAADLLIREPKSARFENESTVTLTSRGQTLAGRINNQL